MSVQIPQKVYRETNDGTTQVPRTVPIYGREHIRQILQVLNSELSKPNEFKSYDGFFQTLNVEAYFATIKQIISNNSNVSISSDVLDNYVGAIVDVVFKKHENYFITFGDVGNLIERYNLDSREIERVMGELKEQYIKPLYVSLFEEMRGNQNENQLNLYFNDMHSKAIVLTSLEDIMRYKGAVIVSCHTILEDVLYYSVKGYNMRNQNKKKKSVDRALSHFMSSQLKSNLNDVNRLGSWFVPNYHDIKEIEVKDKITLNEKKRSYIKNMRVFVEKNCSPQSKLCVDYYNKKIEVKPLYTIIGNGVNTQGNFHSVDASGNVGMVVGQKGQVIYYDPSKYEIIPIKDLHCYNIPGNLLLKTSNFLKKTLEGEDIETPRQIGILVTNMNSGKNDKKVLYSNKHKILTPRCYHKLKFKHGKWMTYYDLHYSDDKSKHDSVNESLFKIINKVIEFEPHILGVELKDMIKKEDVNELLLHAQILFVFYDDFQNKNLYFHSDDLEKTVKKYMDYDVQKQMVDSIFAE